MYAIFVRGGYRTSDCWSWEVRLEDGTYYDAGRSWWLLQDDAEAELRRKYPDAPVSPERHRATRTAQLLAAAARI